MNRRSILGALAAAAGMAATVAAHGQGFPDRPVRVIVPFASGSTPDVVARVLGTKLAARWGQQVVVDAKPGGNGVIAISALKQAAPTGHDLLLVSNSHLSVNPHLLRNASYAVENDFAPVSTVFHTPFFVVASASGPFPTVGKLLGAAKASPGKLNAGVPYLGSPAHLGVVMLEEATATRMTVVPYRDGQQIYTGIAAGDVDWSLATIGSTLPLVQAGKLKLLAIAAPRRMARHPDIPTVAESGGPAGYDVNTWVGLVARAGTPPAVVQRIAADVAEVLKDADLRQQFEKLGIEPESSTPAEMRARVGEESVRYAQVIKRLGITID